MATYSVYEVKNPILKSGVHHLTSDYKTRNKKRPTHNGMDFTSLNAKHTGMTCDYLIAIEEGTVSATGYDKSAGYYVIIKHETGEESVYFHMKKGTIKVKKGQKVSKGTVLGYMGSTGNSSGAHEHFGIRIKKLLKKEYLDPQPYLKGEKSLVKSSVKLPTTHKVVKGDTMSKICIKYYGEYTVALGNKIVKANKKKYPKISLSYIVVGWNLTIPSK